MFRYTRWLTALLLGVMVITAITSIFLRYVLRAPILWGEELMRFSMVWMVFLGTAVAVEESAHISLDILKNKLKGLSSYLISIFVQVAVLSFGLIMVTQGYLFMTSLITQYSSMLGVPMIVVYTSVPMSGIIIVYSTCRRIVSLIREAKTLSE